MQVPLSQPDIGDAEINAVVDVMKSNILSLGKKIPEFESSLANFVGAKYGVAVSSGTAGLHLAVKSLGIGKGDEVITSPFSFVSSANCVMFEGAKPVFVDIDPNTYNIDIDKIESAITDKTKALLPVHIFGHPVDMHRIMDIAKKHNLKVIEDSCEAIGASIEGKCVGTYGDVGVFAFYPNKQMTTGEGGMLVTDNEELAKIWMSLRNQGRADMDLWLAHPRLGYNYRMTELQAAIGVEQIRRLQGILDRRHRVAELYQDMLCDYDKIILPKLPTNGTISWFVYVIQLNTDYDREQFMRDLREKGVGCRPYFTPIHLQPYMVEAFGYKKGDFPITEQISEKTVAIPFFTQMTEEQVKYVTDSIKKLLGD